MPFCSFMRQGSGSHVKPAIGGFMVGIVALFLPQVLGGGYPMIQSAIDGQLAIPLMAMLIFAKIGATAFTISSGGSGGVFAPSLFIGSISQARSGVCATHFFRIS